MEDSILKQLRGKSVIIEDSTLREGEQAAGVAFSIDEKIKIVTLLADIGIDMIEIGVPAMGKEEKEIIKRLVGLKLEPILISWNRGIKSDIDASIECGLKAVNISLPTSALHLKERLKKDKNWILETMAELTMYAKENNLYVSISAEDASRAEVDFIIQYAKAAKQAGANRVRISDTIGKFSPFRYYELIKAILKEVDIDLAIHVHNDFGLATANVLAGIKAGATHVQVTINGLGDRTGISPLEEVVMMLKYIEGREIRIDTKKLKPLCEYVAMVSGRPISPWKPIVGDNIFTHEAGIHINGILKDPSTFEPFSPDEIGLKREITIGKHSGTKGIISEFNKQGIEITQQQANDILEKVRVVAGVLKRDLASHELREIYKMCVSHLKN